VTAEDSAIVLKTSEVFSNRTKEIRAVDSSDNIHYVAGGSVYELAYSGGSYSATPTSFGSGFQTAIGVSLDAAGNLYIADTGSSTIYEIPNESNGTALALNPADQFVVADGVTIQSPVAADPGGNLYFTNNGSSLYELTHANAGIGSLAVASAGTASLGVVFNATETPTIGVSPTGGAFAVAIGGTCVSGATYAPGQSCTVNVQFTSRAPGLAVSNPPTTQACPATIRLTRLARNSPSRSRSQ
jgi:hypothetical protein